MDLIHNSTFRIQQDVSPTTTFAAGLYRVVLDLKRFDTTVAVLIQPEDEVTVRHRGGRSRLEDKDLKSPRKRSADPLVGQLLWMSHSELSHLRRKGLLHKIEIERRVPPPLEKQTVKDLFEHRRIAMSGFLDFKNLEESIVVHRGIGDLVRQATKTTGVGRTFVYKQWSNLCRWGFDEESLKPRLDLCGAALRARPCDPPTGSSRARKKAGRKTLKQRMGLAFSRTIDPEQPGMSTVWAAAVRAADARIPTPKPSWKKRVDLILTSAFCGKAKEQDGRIVLIKPELGDCPNARQIKRVLTYERTQLERILERTTKRHFNSAMRGLVARNWQSSAGPGHTWAIDSTVGDIYLRSSVNPAWIVGRPIVYVVVDIWSTAVVGFHVCLTGPSWATAKIALFNSIADPALLGSLWGYEPILSLTPHPSLCHSLLCDRGEYLSQGQRETAIQLKLHSTEYTPPYRGDLKGLVEVLHRIMKDEQFLFIPGAMNYRRAELEMRRVNPEDCTFTVAQYVQYLHDIFSTYNLSADRSKRVDAHMRAAGVFPSPAGLWRWGWEAGIGFGRHVGVDDMVSKLLVAESGRVRRDSVHFGGCDYMSEAVRDAQWTALARNRGGWDIDIFRYPGSIKHIWTPNSGGAGLLRLDVSDQSMADAATTWDELSDTLALATMQRPEEALKAFHYAADSLTRIKALRDQARLATAEAMARHSGSTPSISEARAVENASMTHPELPSDATPEALKEEEADAHSEMMRAILAAASRKGAGND